MTIIKIGGNCIWPRGTSSIDTIFLNNLLRYLNNVIKKEKLIIIPGGVGGQVFIEWGRVSNCSEVILNQVGCALINISSKIICSYLLKKIDNNITVCPTEANSISEIDTYLKNYDVIVSSVSVDNAVSSDSLAALIAEHTNSKLVLVKNEKPYKNIKGLYEGSHKNILPFRALEKYIYDNDCVMKAGYNSSLDILCLRILKRSNIPTEILTKKEINNYNIIKDVNKIVIKYV